MTGKQLQAALEEEDRPEELRVMLERLEISARRFARASGSDERNVRRWLAGKRAISNLTIKNVRLLRQGKLTIEDLESV